MISGVSFGVGMVSVIRPFYLKRSIPSPDAAILTIRRPLPRRRVPLHARRAGMRTTAGQPASLGIAQCRRLRIGVRHFLGGQAAERRLLAGIGLEDGQQLRYLHEIVHTLLQVQQFHLAASAGRGCIAADQLAQP